MKSFALRCILPFALAVPGMAQAAVTIDQVNLVDVTRGPVSGSSIRTFANSPLGRWGQLQSVTAGLSGTLARLDLQLIVTAQQPRDVAFRIELFAGEPGIDGPLAPTAGKSFTLADVPLLADTQQGALFTADLADLGFEVVAGGTFSYAVTIADERVNRQGPTVVFGYQDGVDESGAPLIVGLDYQGGYNVLLNSDGTRTPTGLDRAFRTWVDVAAVPEPATWALMIGGFGAAGAAVRRRRLAEAAAA